MTKFPVFTRVTGNWAPETGSLKTVSSSGESGANPKSLDQAVLISGGSQVKLSGDGTLPAASLVDLLVARSALTFGADESARLGLGILGRIDPSDGLAVCFGVQVSPR